MRFHLVAAFYVLLLAPVCKLSVGRVALLILLISAVMAFELVNTCIERLCDYIADRYEPVIRVIKDAAAAAVLIVSVAAVAVAVLFFLNSESLGNLWAFFSSNLGLLSALVISALPAALFVCLGPVGIKQVIISMRRK